MFSVDLCLYRVQYVHPAESCFSQALKLWWKNVRFVQHPRYNIPTYKEEALTRDRTLQCCGFSDDNRHLQHRESDQNCCLDEVSSKNRWFRWRDAKWPWS